jgi:capsular polysaccharide biosynthesis protein
MDIFADITPFNKFKDKVVLPNTNVNNRHISYILLENVIILGRNTCYPNCLLYDSVTLLSPYDEKVMSLNKEMFYENKPYHIDINKDTLYNYITYPVYFFIYNFDNYFHFLYDTIPYLCCYFKLKESIPDLKLVVSYPNPIKTEFYKFNEDIFELFNIKKDIIIHDKLNCYQNIYIGNSLTHGGQSNYEPHPEVYNLFKSIIPQKRKIYISRRTWINNDKSNIGTDYTQRRKMMNEDKLVETLVSKGFEEIFCENLSMTEKINLFQNAEIIVGSIGGGMCNLLFSVPETKVICIVSPYFMSINERFKYSMNHTNIFYVNDTYVDKKTNCYPLYIRVRVKETHKIGEIVEVLEEEDSYIVQLSNNDVAGFNNTIEFPKEKFKKNEIEPLDNGLNSPYYVDIDKVIELL